jgi:putative two-component system response regulator
MTPAAIQDREETDRIAALDSCAIAGTPPEPEFDFLTRVAAHLCGTDMAAITFLGENEQFCKSAVGIAQPGAGLEEPFCRMVVESGSPVVVEDAQADDRFSDSVLVAGVPEIRFYAGVAIRTRGEQVIGALCVMGREPRGLSPHGLEMLEGLAEQVAQLVDHRRDAAELSLVQRRIGRDERLAHVAAWEWNPKTDDATWTPELRALLGVSPDVVGSFEAFLEVVHEDDRAHVRSTIESALGSEGGFSYRARIVRGDGAVRTIDNQGDVEIGADGRPTAMWGASVDVTELVEAERASREQAYGLQSAFETALDPILVCDDDRRWVEVNQAACTLLGYERDDLLGMRMEDLVPEPARPHAIAAWNAFMEAGELRGEMELRKFDGSMAPIEFSGTADFVPGLHLAVMRDVSKRQEAERQAADALGRLEETQVLTRVGSWEWDLRSELQVMSEELMRILGRGPDIPRPTYEEFLSYVHEDDRAAFVETVQHALTTREPYTQVFRVVTETGEVRTIESHGRVKVNAAGKAVRIVGAAQDITEHTRVENELRMQANVLDQVPAGVVASNIDRRVTQWSRGAEQLSGVPREEALGSRLDELGLIPPHSKALREVMQAQLREGKQVEGEMDIRHRDGRTFPAFVTNTAVKGVRGEIVGYAGVIVDLTERQSIEREVGLQGYLLDQVEASVFGMDLDRRITHWNRGSEILFGWSREEALGRLVRELQLVVPGQDAYVEAIAAQMENGGSWEREVELQRKDGTTFPGFATSSTVVDPHGEAAGFVGVSVDLTEQKRAEREGRDSQLDTIKRLAMAVVKRDPETGGHIERIGTISAAIAKRLGFDRERVELMRISSPMHDVGKIGIADDILLKPGKLTAEERKVMETHAAIGHDILAGSGTELLDLAAVIALTHHERVDGAGYPHGLSGEEIPIEGRIVAVADVFDALISDRVYRKAFSIETAVEMMKEGRGTQFDPEILDLLLDNLESFVAASRGAAAD